MSIYNYRLIYESVCKKKSAYGECILQDAQNMTEVVGQLGRKLGPSNGSENNSNHIQIQGVGPGFYIFPYLDGHSGVY